MNQSPDISATEKIANLKYFMADRTSKIWVSLIKDRSLISNVPPTFTSFDAKDFAFEYTIEDRGDHAFVFRSFA